MLLKRFNDVSQYLVPCGSVPKVVSQSYAKVRGSAWLSTPFPLSDRGKLIGEAGRVITKVEQPLKRRATAPADG